MKIRDRIVELRRVSASELHPHPNNWRTHPKHQMDAMRGVLSEIGFAGAEIARELPDGSLQLIDGHARAEIAGDSKIPVLILDVDETEANKILATFDPIGALAETDGEKLDAVLRDVDTGNEALQQMLADLAADADLYLDDQQPIVEDEIPEPPADPVTQLGDLWILGDHRLLCGDSTNKNDLHRLAAEKKIDLCFTSPPYNLGKSSSLSGNTTQQKRKNAYLAFDDDNDQHDWLGLMQSMMNVTQTVCDVVIFNVQPLAGNKRVFWKWLAGLSDCLVDVLVWDKQHAAPNIAKGVCSATYELIVIVGKDGASKSIPFASWQGTMQSVYSAPKQTQNEFATTHGATFPLHLPAFIISQLCDEAKTVYDCCMGTGTTLIACEQLNRKCFGMEIDPAYCDVIVNRWENLTGNKASCERTK